MGDWVKKGFSKKGERRWRKEERGGDKGDKGNEINGNWKVDS